MIQHTDKPWNLRTLGENSQKFPLLQQLHLDPDTPVVFSSWSIESKRKDESIYDIYFQYIERASGLKIKLSKSINQWCLKSEDRFCVWWSWIWRTLMTAWLQLALTRLSHTGRDRRSMSIGSLNSRLCNSHEPLSALKFSWSGDRFLKILKNQTIWFNKHE